MIFQKLVDIGRLTQEIRKSSIVTALDYINAAGTNCDVQFKGVLSTQDTETLNRIVSNHVPVPLVQPTQEIVVTSVPLPSAFASKSFGTKKLFKRIHGIQKLAIIGVTELIFVVPYSWVKINGIELVGGDSLDTISLYILDSTTGSYSGHANYQLNQFGFEANIPKDYYINVSEFDADLYQGMQIKVEYTSTSIKKIGLNLLLTEVK